MATPACALGRMFGSKALWFEIISGEKVISGTY
jgi:hypothetical protein